VIKGKSELFYFSYTIEPPYKSCPKDKLCTPEMKKYPTWNPM